MKVVKSDKAGIAEAIRSLKIGKIVVYPTDTAYGLAVDAENFSAVKKLYRLKGRHFKKPMSVIVSSLAQAKKLVQFNPLAEKLFKEFMPGALTLVLPLDNSSQPPLNLRGAAGGLLSAGTKKLGIRMPKNDIALSLVRKLGRPITATSANVSGQPAYYSAGEVIERFGFRRLRPDLILDAGALRKIKTSTVVDLIGRSVRILRKGPIPAQKILQICAKNRSL